jgi:O-antigen ligase
VRVNQAHNDYLQLLVETGLAGFSIAVWFLVLVFRQAAGKLKNWTETASGAPTVAALLGCIGILVHSFLDFNLQIPANAALFYVLCAIAASKPLHEIAAAARGSPAQFDRGTQPGNRGIVIDIRVTACQRNDLPTPHLLLIL